MSGLGPKLPLFLSGEDGAYGLLKKYIDVIKQDFKNLLLTVPGERMMDPLFGIGLSRFLFENNDEETFLEIEGKIKEQVSKYLSFVEVSNVFFNGEENSLYIKVEYKIIPLNYEDFIKIIAPINTL